MDFPEEQIIGACDSAKMDHKQLVTIVQCLMFGGFPKPIIYENDGIVTLEWKNGLTLDYHYTDLKDHQ